MRLTAPQIKKFRSVVNAYYQSRGRHSLLWRKTKNPYKILVSEMMLQQTQVDRVIPKYAAFIKQFPNLASLAKARQADVLRAWQGLGYNRRALFLHRLALATKSIPNAHKDLLALPGIGTYTAAAIEVFAFNQPVTLIETNVRTVFLHHFFKDAHSVSDADILPFIAQTVDHSHPREWYWALMDYGSFLKKEMGNANVRSKHYTKQSKFAGSDRQLRGQVLRALLDGPQTEKLLLKNTDAEPIRLRKVLAGLVTEQFIIQKRSVYMLR